MRRWSRALLCAALLAPAAPARAARADDPEISRLLQTVQRSNVELLAAELPRRARWLRLGSMRVLLGEQIGRFKRQVLASLTIDSDVLEEYRRAITNMSPGDASDIDKLVSAVRRGHGLAAGPPLQRVTLAETGGRVLEIVEEAGPGSDVESIEKGAPGTDAAEAGAARRFGAVGPFLLGRKWNLDFYLGSFADLAPRYRKLGYRRAARLRAPDVGLGRRAYVLWPRHGLRPRLVYCDFDGQDLFIDARARWAALARTAKSPEPIVATLSSPDVDWEQPAAAAMSSLLQTVPYEARTVVVGATPLFADEWKGRLLGVYENDEWRIAYYRLESGIAATLQPLRTDFGEILAVSLATLVRRGAAAVYVAAPAAAVDPRTAPALMTPTDFAIFDGPTVAIPNALAPRRAGPLLFGGLPSPLLATKEWRDDARSLGIVAFDGQLAPLAEESRRWKRRDGGPVTLGIAALVGDDRGLNQEEDPADDATGEDEGDDSDLARYKDAVLAALKDSARDRSR